MNVNSYRREFDPLRAYFPVSGDLFTWLSSYREVVVLLFYVHGKHLRSCRDGQLT